jgi:hypothetical protein
LLSGLKFQQTVVNLSEAVIPQRYRNLCSLSIKTKEVLSLITARCLVMPAWVPCAIQPGVPFFSFISHLISACYQSFLFRLTSRFSSLIHPFLPKLETLCGSLFLLFSSGGIEMTLIGAHQSFSLSTPIASNPGAMIVGDQVGHINLEESRNSLRELWPKRDVMMDVMRYVAGIHCAGDCTRDGP